MKNPSCLNLIILNCQASIEEDTVKEMSVRNSESRVELQECIIVQFAATRGLCWFVGMQPVYLQCRPYLFLTANVYVKSYLRFGTVLVFLRLSAL